MIVKPSIRFLHRDSDSRLVTDTGTILTAMTVSTASYPSPLPILSDVTGALANLSTAMADAAGGGTTLTSMKNDKRAVLVALLRQLASYVTVTSNGDMTVLLSSGFPIQKPQREPIGVLPAPSNLTVTLGDLSGELHANAAPVAGAAIYNWRLSTAAAPTVVVQSAQTTAANNTFSNLTAGVVYNAAVNAVGAAGTGNWSDPVPQMAT
jgi:hypothetical protein